MAPSVPSSIQQLVVLGAGFAGRQVMREARAKGLAVVGTTRSAERAQGLVQEDLPALQVPRLDWPSIRGIVSPASGIVVAFPPDGQTDEPLAEALSTLRVPIVYVSSTAVYGQMSGVIDESTPTCPSTLRGALRLEAETVWVRAGATILRAPGIYGPGRGLHLRLARREVRVAEGATNCISRIHVKDLAHQILGILACHLPGAAYLTGDMRPCPHGEVVEHLSSIMGVPMPVSVPPDHLDESLRNDRKIDGTALRSELGVELLFPTYKEGFENCIQADRALLESLGIRLP